MTRDIVVRHESGWTVREHVDAGTLGIPDDIRIAIERQAERLDDRERRVLEVASVLSGACSAAAIGAAAGEPTSDVEAVLDAMSRRSAFVRRGPTLEWPDGTVSATFEFLHALYREVLGERTSPARRAELHRLIGLRLEAAYRHRAPEIAAELAVHFEESRDLARAVLYHQHAAETERRRSALNGARQHFTRALSLLERLPSSDEREERELSLQIGLGGVLMQISGWGAPAVAQAYERARELCHKRGATPHVFPALWNLWIFYIGARKAGCRVRAHRSPVRAGAPIRRASAAPAGAPCALEHLVPAGRSPRHRSPRARRDRALPARSLRFGDAGVRQPRYRRLRPRPQCQSAGAMGRPDAALTMMNEAVARARALDHPFTLAFALAHAAALHQFRREAAATRDVAAAAHEIASEHCFPLLLTWSKCLLGWSVAELGEASTGIAMLREGLRIAEATGSEVYKAHWLGLLASAEARNGLVGEARHTLEKALEARDRPAERFYLAELYRLRGELHLTSGGRRRVPISLTTTSRRRSRSPRVRARGNCCCGQRPAGPGSGAASEKAQMPRRSSSARVAGWTKDESCPTRWRRPP